jgi:hypothetical protein
MVIDMVEIGVVIERRAGVNRGYWRIFWSESLIGILMMLRGSQW